MVFEGRQTSSHDWGPVSRPIIALGRKMYGVGVFDYMSIATTFFFCSIPGYWVGKCIRQAF